MFFVEVCSPSHAYMSVCTQVVYDDCSTDNITETLQPLHDLGLVTYINWTMYSDHPGVRPSRQFAAMEDFAIRFSWQSKLIAQFDDDCYFHAPPAEVPGSLPSSAQSTELRTRLSFLMREFPYVGQFKIMGKWFGACTKSSATSNHGNFVMERSIPNTPPFAQYFWRYDPVDWFVVSHATLITATPWRVTL
jgi:hypothetical protein